MGVPRFNNPEEGLPKTLEQLYVEHSRRMEAKIESASKFAEDPLGFVKWAWRWGLPGALEKFEGPDKWQEDFLIDLGEQIRARKFDGRNGVKPIKMAVAAGKGIGKSGGVGMLTTYIMQCWPYCQGTVTANTFSQLESKTWATIEQWFKTSRLANKYIISGASIRHRIHGKSWQVTPQTCKEENSEAFAGQHAANSVQFYIFDEGSAIPEKIYEVAESGMVDGMPMMFVFGNPTRSNGKFFQINFGKDKPRWNSRVIDARNCMIPNQETLKESIEEHGEDSDYVRVYIKGLPPNASDMQYIDSGRVFAAQKRLVATLDDEPLVAGVDLARGGEDKAVIRFRRGSDARSIPPIKIPGELVRDSMLLVAKLTDLAGQKFGGTKERPAVPVSAWFLDGGGVGGPIIDRIKQLGHTNFFEIQFGSAAPDPKHFANMRSWMWSKMRDWLGTNGCIDPKDSALETDLTGVGLSSTERGGDRLLLESKESMKKRGMDSPDDGDSLCLSFARTVKVKTQDKPKQPQTIGAWGNQGRTNNSWMEY